MGVEPGGPPNGVTNEAWGKGETGPIKSDESTTYESRHIYSNN